MTKKISQIEHPTTEIPLAENTILNRQIVDLYTQLVEYLNGPLAISRRDHDVCIRVQDGKQSLDLFIRPNGDWAIDREAITDSSRGVTDEVWALLAKVFTREGRKEHKRFLATSGSTDAELDALAKAHADNLVDVARQNMTFLQELLYLSLQMTLDYLDRR